MSRLVDADDLIEVIKESRPLNWTDSESEIQEDADYNHFIEMVNAQPTAYDVEKVVAELEYEKEKAEKERAYWEQHDWRDARYFNNADLADTQVEDFDDAIEIVRKGGVE